MSDNMSVAKWWRCFTSDSQRRTLPEMPCVTGIRNVFLCSSGIFMKCRCWKHRMRHHFLSFPGKWSNSLDELILADCLWAASGAIKFKYLPTTTSRLCSYQSMWVWLQTLLLVGFFPILHVDTSFKNQSQCYEKEDVCRVMAVGVGAMEMWCLIHSLTKVWEDWRKQPTGAPSLYTNWHTIGTS